MSDNKVEFSSTEAEEYLVDVAVGSAVTLAKVIENINPVEMFVLRSHLWIEREFEQILELLVPYPKAILEARFTFAHKLTLIKAFWGNDPHKCELLARINVLNQIRNQMAHQLDSPKLPKLFEKINIEYPLTTANKQQSEEVVEKVKLGLADIQGTLIGIKSMMLLRKAGHSVKAVES